MYLNKIPGISLIKITTDTCKLFIQIKSIKHKFLPLSDKTVSWVLQQSPAILKPELKKKQLLKLILFNNLKKIILSLKITKT